MKTKAATDVGLRKRKGVVLAPSRENSLHRAPEGSGSDPHLPGSPPESQWGAYETKAEFDEAVGNFLAYLEILREWDAKEKAAHDGPPVPSPND